MLRILSAKKQRAFYESQQGNLADVLFEQDNRSGYLYGFSGNYVRVKVAYDPLLCNTVVKLKLGEFDEEGNLTGLIPHFAPAISQAGL